MKRLGIVAAVLAAALLGPGATSAQVAPACGAFDVVAAPNEGEGLDLRAIDAAGSEVWTVGHRYDAAGTRDGSPLAMRWNGSTFVTEPVPDLSHLGVEPSLDSVALASGAEPWVVGGLRDAVGGNDVPLVLRWSAGFWQTYPVTYLNSFAARHARLRDVAAIAPDDAWAVGLARGASKTVEPFAAHWDGIAWSEAPFPGSTGDRILTAVSATRRSVWAVGYDSALDGVRGATFARIFVYQGGEWIAVATPPELKVSAMLTDVVAIAENDVWAVGTAGTQGLFLHFDGASWSMVGGPANSDPRSVSGVAGNDVWAAGSKGRYHWDGALWTFIPAPSSLGTGVRGAVAVAGPCDVWSVASMTLATPKSTIERVSATISVPPAAPVGLVAVAKTKEDIALAWEYPGSDPTGSVPQHSFVIERCIGSGRACVTRFDVIAKVSGKTISYLDSGLPPGTSYGYRVFAANAAGMSEPTEMATATTLPDETSGETAPARTPANVSGSRADTVPPPPYGPPPAPVDLRVEAGQREIAISWAPGSDGGPSSGGGFIIDRCLGAAAQCVSRYTVIGKVEWTVTQFVDAGLQPSSSYTYRVYAVNGAGLSPVPPPITATTLGDTSSPLPDVVPQSSLAEPVAGIVMLTVPQQEPPATPANLVARAESSRRIVLAWQSGGDPTLPADELGYVVERCLSDRTTCLSRFTAIAKVAGTTFADISVQPATMYAYRIVAVNEAGKSAPTAPETVISLPTDPTSSRPRPTSR